MSQNSTLFIDLFPKILIGLITEDSPFLKPYKIEAIFVINKRTAIASRIIPKNLRIT